MFFRQLTVSVALAFSHALCRLRCINAPNFAALRVTIKNRELGLLHDRIALLQRLAVEASAVSQQNDTRKLCMIVRSLAGICVKPATGIRDKDGVLLQDTQSIAGRWKRYARELFHGYHLMG